MWTLVFVVTVVLSLFFIVTAFIFTAHKHKFTLILMLKQKLIRRLLGTPFILTFKLKSIEILSNSSISPFMLEKFSTARTRLVGL